MSNNEALYKRALDAIRELYGDKSVSVEQARENLQGLRDEISIMLDALD